MSLPLRLTFIFGHLLFSRRCWEHYPRCERPSGQMWHKSSNVAAGNAFGKLVFSYSFNGFFGLKGQIHLQKSKTSCIGIGTTNRFKEMGFISQVLQVVSRKGFNWFLLGNNIRGFVTWHSSLWALSEPLMISTALAGTREKQKQMKMKVSRNVEI